MPDRTRPIRKEICLNEQELNLIQHKMRAGTEGAARAFFRCVRTPDVLAILQYSLIRVFQIVLFIGRTL